MRDLETTSAAITAAETGHLVLCTLHTINAPQTIERIIDIYPADQQNQIRSMLANTLQAVITQTLFKRIDQPGMVPVHRDHALHPGRAQLHPREPDLRDPEHHRDLAADGHAELDDSIAEMYFKGFIDRDEAIVRSSNPGKMEKTLAAAGKINDASRAAVGAAK